MPPFRLKPQDACRWQVLPLACPPSNLRHELSGPNAPVGSSRQVACASSFMSMRTSLEKGIKLHRFASIFPEQFFSEASRHREAVVAADQRMVIRYLRDDLAHFVHDVSHVPPPHPTDRALLTLHSGDIMVAYLMVEGISAWPSAQRAIAAALIWIMLEAGEGIPKLHKKRNMFRAGVSDKGTSG
jgi:hypothetical protein